MRLFTAVDIPNEVKIALGTMIGRLRPAAKLKWTDVEKLHITTKFIGEWPEERLEEMRAVLAGVGSPGAIRIAIRGVCWTPDARHPRMLWAGVEAAPGLESLAHETEQAVQILGAPVEDRKYSPHLTLARIRDRVPLGPLRHAIESEQAAEFGSFVATAFYLYLSKDGRYSKLAEFSLV
jgi:RNA 2',3'-cyclic 3'-phosphodiesterase